MVARSRLTRVDPPRLVEYQGTINGFWSVDRLTFADAQHGTRVQFYNDSEPIWLLRPLTPILNAAFQPQARKAVDGARVYLERLD